MNNEMDDILKKQEEIISDLDSLDELFSEYLKYEKGTKVLEGFNPFISLKKKNLLKEINSLIQSTTDNLNLLEKMMFGKKITQLDDDLVESNVNVKKMAKRLIKIQPNYEKLKGKDETLDYNWEQLLYQIMEQDDHTKKYNKKAAKGKPQYVITSIFDELKVIAKNKGIDFNVFLSEYHPKEPPKPSI